MALPFSGVRKSFDQAATPVLGVKLLVRQADDLARLDVDLVDVRAAVPIAGGRVVEVGVVDPLAVEGDVRIGDRALAAGDQDFLAAVGVQQHQVGAADPHVGRMVGIRPDERRLLLAVPVLDEARGADVDDVVVVLDRLVRRRSAAARR